MDWYIALSDARLLYVLGEFLRKKAHMIKVGEGKLGTHRTRCANKNSDAAD